MENGKSAMEAGLFEPVPLVTAVSENILSPLRCSYMYPDSEQCFTYCSAYLVKNNTLEDRYSAFREQKKKEGYTESELEESFGFLMCDEEIKAKQLCESGIDIDQSALSTLGDPSKGVYISKYSDCLDLNPWYHGKTGFIVLFRLTKGRVKKVTENYTQNFTQPSVGFDCYISEQIDTVSATTSSFLAYERTQYYMYELCSRGEAVTRPRQVYPFAVVRFTYGKTMLSATHLMEQRSSPETGVFQYTLWQGQLQIHSMTIPVALRSRHGALLPAQLPTTLEISNSISVSDLKQWLLQSSYDTCFTSEVLRGNGCNFYTVIPLADQDKHALLSLELKDKDLALVLQLKDSGFLVLLHSSAFLTYEDTLSSQEDALQALFIFPDSRLLQKDTKSRWSKSPLSSEIIKALPGFIYAVTEANCPFNQQEAVCCVVERHLQSYAALLQPGMHYSPFREANIFPDQYDVPDVIGYLYNAPKWTERSHLQLLSYLKQPGDYTLPVTRVTELLEAGRDENINDQGNDIYYCLSSPEDAGVTSSDFCADGDSERGFKKSLDQADVAEVVEGSTTNERGELWMNEQRQEGMLAEVHSIARVSPPAAPVDLVKCGGLGVASFDHTKNMAEPVTLTAIGEVAPVQTRDEQEVIFGQEVNSTEAPVTSVLSKMPDLSFTQHSCTAQESNCLRTKPGVNAPFKKTPRRGRRKRKRGRTANSYPQENCVEALTQPHLPKRRLYQYGLKTIITDCGKIFVPHGSDIPLGDIKSMVEMGRTMAVECNLKQLPIEGLGISPIPAKNVHVQDLATDTTDRQVFLPEVADEQNLPIQTDDQDTVMETTDAQVSSVGIADEQIQNLEAVDRQAVPLNITDREAMPLDREEDLQINKALISAVSSSDTESNQNKGVQHQVVPSTNYTEKNVGWKTPTLERTNGQKGKRKKPLCPISQVSSVLGELRDLPGLSTTELRTKRSKSHKTANEVENVIFNCENTIANILKSDSKLRNCLSLDAEIAEQVSKVEGNPKTRARSRKSIPRKLDLVNVSAPSDGTQEISKNLATPTGPTVTKMEKLVKPLKKRLRHKITEYTKENGPVPQAPHLDLLDHPGNNSSDCLSACKKSSSSTSCQEGQGGQDVTRPSAESSMRQFHPKDRRRRFTRVRQVEEVYGSLKVSRVWQEKYEFHLDSKYTNNSLEKAVMRALHGPWDYRIEETFQQIRLILHMWIALFYSRSTARFFEIDPSEDIMRELSPTNGLHDEAADPPSGLSVSEVFYTVNSPLSSPQPEVLDLREERKKLTDPLTTHSDVLDLSYNHSEVLDLTISKHGTEKPPHEVNEMETLKSLCELGELDSKDPVQSSYVTAFHFKMDRGRDNRISDEENEQSDDDASVHEDGERDWQNSTDSLRNDAAYNELCDDTASICISSEELLRTQKVVPAKDRNSMFDCQFDQLPDKERQGMAELRQNRASYIQSCKFTHVSFSPSVATPSICPDNTEKDDYVSNTMIRTDLCDVNADCCNALAVVPANSYEDNEVHRCSSDVTLSDKLQARVLEAEVPQHPVQNTRKKVDYSENSSDDESTVPVLKPESCNHSVCTDQAFTPALRDPPFYHEHSLSDCTHTVAILNNHSETWSSTEAASSVEPLSSGIKIPNSIPICGQAKSDAQKSHAANIATSGLQDDLKPYPDEDFELVSSISTNTEKLLHTDCKNTASCTLSTTDDPQEGSCESYAIKDHDPTVFSLLSSRKHGKPSDQNSPVSSEDFLEQENCKLSLRDNLPPSVGISSFNSKLTATQDLNSTIGGCHKSSHKSTEYQQSCDGELIADSTSSFESSYPNCNATSTDDTSESRSTFIPESKPKSPGPEFGPHPPFSSSSMNPSENVQSSLVCMGQSTNVLEQDPKVCSSSSIYDHSEDSSEIPRNSTVDHNVTSEQMAYEVNSVSTDALFHHLHDSNTKLSSPEQLFHQPVDVEARLTLVDQLSKNDDNQHVEIAEGLSCDNSGNVETAQRSTRRSTDHSGSGPQSNMYNPDSMADLSNARHYSDLFYREDAINERTVKEMLDCNKQNIGCFSFQKEELPLASFTKNDKYEIQCSSNSKNDNRLLTHTLVRIKDEKECSTPTLATSIITVLDSEGRRVIYEKCPTVKPVSSRHIRTTIQNSFLQNFLQKWEKMHLTKPDITQDTMDLEYLIFSEKINQILKKNQRTTASCRISRYPWRHQLNSNADSGPCNSPGIKRLSETGGLLLKDCHDRKLPFTKRKINVDFTEKTGSKELRSCLPFVPCELPWHLDRLSYLNGTNNMYPGVSSITAECSSSYQAVMNDICSSREFPQHARKPKMDYKFLPQEMREQPDLCCQTEQEMFTNLQEQLNTVVRQSFKTKFRFYILVTAEDIFFKQTKEVLEAEGHVSVDPEQFEVELQSTAMPLLIILRNEDIAEYICTIPHLLQLKKTPSVLFAGVDQPDDVLNLTHQELFNKGGFVVCDSATLDSLRLDEMKTLVELLERLSSNGKWTWFLHYRDCRMLKEKQRTSMDAKKRKQFLDWCQEAGVVKAMPYHECDVLAGGQPDYLNCLLHLQAEHATTRFAVFITDTPEDSFGMYGISVMKIDAFLQMYRNNAGTVIL